MTAYVCSRCGATLATVRRPGDPPWSVYLPAACSQCRAERDRVSAAQLTAAIVRERERLA
jgi:DNA-directed RNA polymerase subunit RPC12/RpoP